MRIYSDYVLKDYPNSVKVVDWYLDEETCPDDTYLIRLSQDKEPDNWFRNLKLIKKETVDLGANYHPNIRYQTTCFITYERKHEYYYVEIGEKINDLINLMNEVIISNYSAGIVLKDNDLWLDYVGE